MIHYGKAPLSATTDRWYGFSVYISSDELKLEDKSHVLIFQLHATPDFTLKEPWRVPPVSLSGRISIPALRHGVIPIFICATGTSPVGSVVCFSMT